MPDKLFRFYRKKLAKNVENNIFISFSTFFSTEYGYFEIVKLLLEKGANLYAENDYALRWASLSFFAKKVQVNNRYETYLLFYQTRTFGSCQIIVRIRSRFACRWWLCIDRGFIVTFLKKRRLMGDTKRISYFTEISNLEVVKTLLEKGANLHANDNHTLMLDSCFGHYVVKLLLENGANIQSNNNNALIWASGYDHIINLLLERGGKIPDSIVKISQ